MFAIEACAFTDKCYVLERTPTIHTTAVSNQFAVLRREKKWEQDQTAFGARHGHG